MITELYLYNLSTKEEVIVEGEDKEEIWETIKKSFPQILKWNREDYIKKYSITPSRELRNEEGKIIKGMITKNGK